MKVRLAASIAALFLLAACRGAAPSSEIAPDTFASPLPLGGAQPITLGDGNIQHVVIVIQENRSFDDLFDGFPGADSAAPVALSPIDLQTGYDLVHSHKAFEADYDGGRLDGFGSRARGHVPRSQIGPYWKLASAYTLADRMFQSNAGPSMPAHMFLLAGTSAIQEAGPWYAENNPIGPNTNTACDVSAALQDTINIDTGEPGPNVRPCIDVASLVDAVESAGKTWRYYEADFNSPFWNAPGAISDVRYSPEYSADVITPPSQFLRDLRAGQLASVTWITPTAAASDHAGYTDGTGPDWVASIVNTIGRSSFWNTTAIFIVWDDWGGWYDHVAPPQRNAYELGFRVPLIVISPYSRHGYISHVQHEFGSILRFTEESLGLPTLNSTDALADDLSDCFDFSQSPQPFAAIAADHNAAYFEQLPIDNRPPDDD